MFWTVGPGTLLVSSWTLSFNCRLRTALSSARGQHSAEQKFLSQGRSHAEPPQSLGVVAPLPRTRRFPNISPTSIVQDWGFFRKLLVGSPEI